MKLPVYVLFVLLLAGADLIWATPSSGRVVVVSTEATCNLADFSGSGSEIRPTDSPSDCSLTITDALQNLTTATTLNLQPGIHYVSELVVIRDLQNVSVVGVGGNGAATITCAPGLGLAAFNVSNLLFQNIQIVECHLNGTRLTNTLELFTTSVDFFYRYPDPDSVGTGLLLGHCSDVVMVNVSVTNITGYGLLAINVIGNSRFSGMEFISNGVSDTESCKLFPSRDEREILSVLQTRLAGDNIDQYGSGAVFLYQSFNGSYNSMYNNRVFTLDIDSSLFRGNRECSFVYQNYLNGGDSQYLDTLGYRIGGGAGMTLILAQQEYGVNVSVRSTMFHNNTGFFGGSVQVVMFQRVKNTNVLFEDCTFHENGAAEGEYVGNSSSIGAGGIAAFIDIPLPDQNDELASQFVHSRNATFKVLGSTFSQNRAQYGGAVYIFSRHASAVNDISDVFVLSFDNCTFLENKAFIGSALSVNDLKLSGMDIGMQMYFNNTHFLRNMVEDRTPDGSVSVGQNFGTLDIVRMNVTFYGNCLIQENNGTGVRAEESLIGIAGDVTFQGNRALYGGAFYLLTLTFVVLSSDSSLYLRDNIAQLAGGAFFVNEVGLSTFSAGGGFYHDCFLYFSYNNFLLCSNCSDLNSTGVYVEFTNNRAPSGSDVYGSALYSCPWAVNILGNETDVSIFEILHRKYPNIFKFDRLPRGPELVQSIPANLLIENRDELPTRVAPGEVFNVTFATYDDFDQIIATVISSFVADSRLIVNVARNNTNTRLSENNFGVLMNDVPTQIPVTIIGNENQEVVIVVYSVDLARRAQVTFSFEIISCGFGFDFDPDLYICVCNDELSSLGVECDPSTHSLQVRSGLWVGPIGDDDIGVHECIFQFCQSGRRVIPITNDTNNITFDVQCDVDLNRNGILCGACKDGYSITLGSPKCLRCSNLYALLFVVFVILGWIVIYFIRYLRITIAEGLLNGVIFYSNIVSLYGITLVPDTQFKNLFMVSIPTLNLGIETCFYNGMGSLERVWWQLSFPLYLFLLMGITTLLARTRCGKVFSGSSTTQTFATLLIVCYVSVLQACAELVGFVRIRTVQDDYYLGWITNPAVPYFSAQHAPLAVLAILLSIFYLFPLPLFLLFPTLVYRSKYLSKYKPIYDAFWNPFERDYRFWLGLRLIFRWIPFVVVFTVRPPVNIFITSLMLLLLLFLQMVLKPFKGIWTNVVDSLFLLNLVCIFVGSVFFYSESEYNLGINRRSAERSGFIFIQFLMVLGFLGFLGVFVYHVILRFPKLKNAILYVTSKKKRKQYKLEKKNNPVEKKEIHSGSGIHQDSESMVFSEPSQFTASELREPLLDSGTVEFVPVSISTVPTRLTGALN